MPTFAQDSTWHSHEAEIRDERDRAAVSFNRRSTQVDMLHQRAQERDSQHQLCRALEQRPADDQNERQ